MSRPRFTIIGRDARGRTVVDTVITGGYEAAVEADRLRTDEGLRVMVTPNIPDTDRRTAARREGWACAS